MKRTLSASLLVLLTASPATAADSPPATAAPPTAEATFGAGPAPAEGRTPPDAYAFRPSVMAGLSQWTLFGGGNVAGQLKFGRAVVEYSHGQGLRLDQVAALGLSKSERDAGVDVALVWTTGGGVGVQITPNLHVLIEAKAHRYEVRGADASTLRYTTYTVGPGVFYDLYLYKGLFLQPSLRWWPTVASTYDGDRSLTGSDGAPHRHARHDLMPFPNVSIGWTFAGR